MSLGHTLSLTFFCKKKKIVRLRFSYSFVYVDSTRFQLASSMIMKNFCTTLFICILDIYSAILLAIVSNFVSIFGTFGCHLFTDIPNFVIQIQSVGNMKLIFAYEPYFNFGCMKYQSTVLTMYLTIVGIFYKQSTDPLVFSYLCFLAHFISAFRINDQCILTLWLRPCLYIFYKINWVFAAKQFNRAHYSL